LAGPVLTVRNTPAFVEARFRPTGDPIRVLYHGIIAPNRGLEATIDSVPDWRAEFSLTIRGPAEQHYADALRQRIEQRGMADRIFLAPPVPMTELVQEAASFDIGFFALPGNSRHNEFALPNKFFEYIMAGLALCVTDLPEMHRLIRQYELGITISRVTPAAIAKAINHFDRDLIDACKRRSLAAARELCWERESERLINAYETAVEWRTASA
jgi:glycosyltransferase involved in cell wall biosynthesis